MAGRRSARVFLPLLVDEFRLVSWNSGTRPVESNGLARAANLALRGARYETSSYVRRARPGASARLPFAVPQEASQIGTSQQLDGAGVVLGVAPGLAPGGRGAASMAAARSTAAPSPVPPSTEGGVRSTGTSSQLTLPPLDRLRELNPEMAAIVEQHDQQKRAAASVREVVMQALETHVGRGTNLNKTALGKIKIDALRDVLRAIDSDARGNKASLVARVLDEVRKDDEDTRAEEVAGALGTGPASRKQMIKLQRSKSDAYRRLPVAQDTATLHAANGTARSEEASEEALNVQYTRVFGSPDDVAQILVDANATDVVMINVRGKCAFTDHMIISSAPSHQSVHMVAGAVLHELKQRCKEVAPGIAPSVEGADDPSPDWLVVDAGSIVVHVFHEDSRATYDLEGLWSARDKSNVTRVAMRHKMTLSSIKTQ
jgi:ribosome silencing factor RsfS/YbeB/iojap